MSQIRLAQILKKPMTEDNFDTAKFVLYHWNVPTRNGKEYSCHGRIAILDPTLTAICNVDGLPRNPIVGAEWLARLVYLAANEMNKFPESVDDFSSYIIIPKNIGTKINRRIVEGEDATPYRKPEIDDLIERAYAQLTDHNIENFERWEKKKDNIYPKWNRASGYEYHILPFEGEPVPVYLLYHVDNNFCRVIVIDKRTSREMYHFELYDNKNNVLETLSGVGGESARVRNKYLIGQPVRPEELIHPSDLPDFHECLSKPSFGKFSPYNSGTIYEYRTNLRFANADK